MEEKKQKNDFTEIEDITRSIVHFLNQDIKNKRDLLRDFNNLRRKFGWRWSREERRK